MTNIELFNTYAAQILAQLYERFPVKTYIDLRKLCGHTDTDDFGQVVDDTGRPSAAFEVARATVVWLAETGYLRVGQTSPYGVSDAVLTERGLECLRAAPEALKSKTPAGESLVRLLREGSLGLAKEVVKAVLAAGAKGLLS